MNSLGYSNHIVDIFEDWEEAKDEVLIPERKKGTGHGTAHIFLGAADSVLRKEFSDYYTLVENGGDPNSGAIKIKHFFSKNNIISMIGHVCEYDFSRGHFSKEFIENLLTDLKNKSSDYGLLQTNSLFKLSVGGSKLRPYFKSFDDDGVFSKVVRKLLLPQSLYKISLYRNKEGEYAAFWLLGFKGNSNFESDLVITTNKKNISSLQTIFFGTPGSGKSHRVKELTKDKTIHRTTFHPDSDYASFVGCYKPTMSKRIKKELTESELKQKLDEFINKAETYPVLRFAAAYPEIQNIPSIIREEWFTSDQEKESMDTEIKKGVACAKELHQHSNSSDISYSFIPQVFTEAYIDAWLHSDKEIYLVIEEINRGNCAQIFGDLFQLLDRNAEGKSDYRIKADNDLRDYLYSQLGKDHEGIKNGELCLPSNLCIFATMNTSDQSLFPMDSAFKRRWDWEYVPIDYSEDMPSSKFVITLGDKKYYWIDFLIKVNQRIREVTDSEDKQMGNFFIKTNVSESEFKSKVMFYLWNEICRDEYRSQSNFFRTSHDTEFSFNDLYQVDGLAKLHGFMEYLDVKSHSASEKTPNEESQEIKEA